MNKHSKRQYLHAYIPTTNVYRQLKYGKQRELRA